MVQTLAGLQLGWTIICASAFRSMEDLMRARLGERERESSDGEMLLRQANEQGEH